MKNLTNFRSKINVSIVLAMGVGLIFGLVLFVLVRLIFNNSAPIHYHANFAVFINDTREIFDGPGYYEEIQACSATTSPRGRTHLHQPDNNVVHVHDKNVTWGHFFESIGWALGPDTLATNDASYRSGGGKTLTFLLNGNKISSPFDQVVGNEDTLLVSYGDGSADLKKQAEAAKKPTAAHTANVQKDPAACRGSEELSFGARFKNAIW